MFFQVKTSEEVLEILTRFSPCGEETVDLGKALNRVVSQAIIAPEDLPAFPRSTMDGYAVRAKDTYGASDSLPVFLEVAGDVSMGQAPLGKVTPGNAFRIATGGMLPDGADAVVMIEYCHALDEKTIEVSRSVSPMEHVISPGDDVEKGAVLFERGSMLRPQDLGLLAGLGIKEIAVYRRPRVAIVSTGDEIVPLEQRPEPGQVRDINSYTLSAFCAMAGALPINLGLCRDRFPELRALVASGLETADSVWVSGGSSVGARDITVQVLESFPEMELLAHGITISPGKPTIIARIGDKAVFGLPGHVASAMVVAEVFLNPFLARLSGEAQAGHHFSLQAELTRNIESASGRDDYIRVKLEKREGRYFAEPVFGKSGLISPLVQAHGLVKIDRHTEGLYQGQVVDVLLFRPITGAI